MIYTVELRKVDYSEEFCLLTATSDKDYATKVAIDESNSYAGGSCILVTWVDNTPTTVQWFYEGEPSSEKPFTAEDISFTTGGRVYSFLLPNSYN